MDWSKHLNKEQLEAVTIDSKESKPVVIIAGAGTGKTRVLTYRLAYLIKELGVAPRRILAITFTNKAANEMKARTEKLVPEVEGDLKIMTFHAFCARFLRREAHNIGYPSNFTIYDEDDQKKLIRALAARRGYPQGGDVAKHTAASIAKFKTIGKYPEDLNDDEYKELGEKSLELWQDYEQALTNAYALDFDDLLGKTRNILRDFPDVCAEWQKKFDHILIDEFQDTNDVQYEFVEYLMGKNTTLYVVGDPDQTIYTWRGANQDILLKMAEHDESHILILNIIDRNYRSTQKILDAANNLIDKNTNRIKKELKLPDGKDEEGKDVAQYNARTADLEASWVIEEIMGLNASDKDFSYRDVVVMYRSSYLTSPIERALMKQKIPYVVYGGVRFYQRKEIKDVLAYWRLLVNRRDNVSFERIVNIPTRGIGRKTLAILEEESEAQGYSLYEYILFLDDYASSELQPSKRQILKDLIIIMESYRKRIEDGQEVLAEVLEEYITEVGYFEFLKIDEEREDARRENVNQLIAEVYNSIKSGAVKTLDEYLQNASLYTSQDEIESGEYVTLMTVHVAKGLEYPNVFVIGLNEGVFPSYRSLREDGEDGLEEERRLAFVAFTRAQERLFLSCNNDFSYTLLEKQAPSRFFKEAGLAFPKTGKQFVFDERIKNETTYQAPEHNPQKRSFDIKWESGDIAYHKVFGRGVVISVVDNTILEINFSSHGIKKIMAQHPSIEKVVPEGDLS